IIAKATGQVNLLNLTFILFPVTRNTIWVWFFGIPFERAIKYHRWIGRWTYGFFTLHGIFMVIYNAQRNNIAYIISTLRTDYGYVFAGLVAWACFTLMVLFTFGFIRRKIWELFYYSHFLFIPGLVFASL